MTRLAAHIPYYLLEQHLRELDRSRPLAHKMASGQRSTLACSILQRHSFSELFNVTGGMDAWNEAGYEKAHT